MRSAIRTKEKNHPANCLCPVCSGLHCAERPRYFAGMLLTEAELSSQQAYGLAKQRLHNRNLHGSGIVCGLQVTCHDCEGWVTIHPGHALDPCGNDIVVCEADDFNLIAAIRACKEEEKRQSVCDPWRAANRAECKDVEEEWCITIRYTETEARPTTALRNNLANRCGCGGHCGGAGQCSCSCHKGGNGHGNGKTLVTQHAAGACEATRIRESYTLGVIPAACCDDQRDDDNDRDNRNAILARLLKALETVGIHVPLTELVACYTPLLAFAQRGQRIRDMAVESPFGAATIIYRDLCRLKEDIAKHLLKGPRLNCELLDLLGLVVCPPPPTSDNDAQQFQAQVIQALNGLGQILLLHLVDCICYHTLPGCQPDPCEDRLILACVTVEGDRIKRICHTKCRRYVLTPHSLVPLILNLLLDDLCCGAFQFRQPGLSTVDRPTGFVGAVRTPTVSAVANLYRRFTEATRAETPADETPIDTATWLGTDPQTAAAALRERKVTEVEVVDVQWSDRESVINALESPVVAAGQSVKMFVQDGQVVGFARLSETESLRRELRTANQRMTQLENRLTELLANRGGG